YRRLMADVAAQMHDDDVRVAGLQLVEQVGGGVAAAVVDEHELIGQFERAQRLGQAAIQLFDVFLLVEERHDDADFGYGAMCGHRFAATRKRPVSVSRTLYPLHAYPDTARDTACAKRKRARTCRGLDQKARIRSREATTSTRT